MSSPRAPSAQSPAMTVHIERLVLHGVPLTSAQSGRLQSALQHELKRLTAEGSGTWRAGATPLLVGPALCVSSPARPAELGRDIARSLYQSLRILP